MCLINLHLFLAVVFVIMLFILAVVKIQICCGKNEKRENDKKGHLTNFSYEVDSLSSFIVLIVPL
jgi:hypothetical protein